MIRTKKTTKANLERKKGTFFLIGLVAALCFVLFAFEWKTSNSTVVKEFNTTDFVPDEFIFVPRTFDKKEVAKPIIKAPNIVLVEDNVETSNDLDLFNSDPEDITPVDFSVFTEAKEEVEDSNLDDIVSYAEVMPEFPGGYRALLNYLAQNVKYPVIAQENGIQGRVYVNFIVDEKGNIYNASIARGVDQSLNIEALRVVETMPKWKPGMQGGKAVKVRYTVPINFVLQ